MNRTVSRLALVKLFILLAVSCGRTSAPKVAETPEPPEAPVASESPHAFLERLASSDEPVRLCNQVLTSEETILSLRDPVRGPIAWERWPAKAAFFEPEPGIIVDKDVLSLKNRYNLLELSKMVYHAYDIYNYRKLECMEDEVTEIDHKAIIADAAPIVSSSVLRSAIVDRETRASAARVLASFRKLDGEQDSMDRLNEALMDLGSHLEDFPSLVSSDLMDEFSSGFGDWYRKDVHVESIGDLIRIAHHDSGDRLSEQEIEMLLHAVECEKDIDRRAILALEYSKFAEMSSFLLGEIIESGIYTKYLFEVWISWRAAVQFEWMGMSTSSLIPDLYYSTLLAKCINTYLKHMQACSDPFDRCMIEAMLATENLDRFDGVFGNEAISSKYNLRSNMFFGAEKYN